MEHPTAEPDAPLLVADRDAGVLVAACGGSSGSILAHRRQRDRRRSGRRRGVAARRPPPAEAPAGRAAAGGQPHRRAAASPPSAPRDDLKIVYTGSLELVVDDLQAALAKAKAAVARHRRLHRRLAGGQRRRPRPSPPSPTASRPRAGRTPSASLRGLATEVVGEQTQATEVGGQLVDIEARLRNLRASEAVARRTIAKGTGKVTDLLEVEAQLTDVRGQIEQLDGQRLQLQDQVAYGTLVTTFGTEIVAGPGDRQGLGSRRPTSTARPATLIGGRPGDRLRGDLVRHRLAAPAGGHRRDPAHRAARGPPRGAAEASRPGPRLGRPAARLTGA